MKLKNMFLFCGAVLFGALTLTSCSDEETYDFDGVTGIRIYMDKTMSIPTTNILKTPVGVVGSFDVDVNLKSTSLVSSNVTAQISYDDSYVDSYNTANNTEYQKLPAGSVSLDKTSLTITPEEMTSDACKVTFNIDNVSQLENGKSYLVPVALTEVNGQDVRLARDEKFRVKYFVLNYMETNSLINDGATGISGNIADLKNFTCVQADNLDPEEYATFAATEGWYKQWSILQQNSSNASFTLDMGSSHKVSGFYIQNYVMTDCYVEISDDNAKWTELGHTSEHNYVIDYSTYNYAWVLYAGIPARYIRFSMTLNPSHPYWRWGYGIVSSLDIYVED